MCQIDNFNKNNLYEKEFIDLLKEMLSLDPEKRINS